jgi:cell division protein FtsQ
MAKKALLSHQSVVKKRKESKRHLFVDLLKFVSSVSFKVTAVIAGMIIVSLLFIWVYKCLTNTSYLKLTTVQVTGVDDGIQCQIIKMAGLNKNLSLLTLNPNDIKAKIEKHPWIRSVELEKRFPHTLIIKAEKESPRAVVLFDKMFYMDKWGKVFKELEEGDNSDFPVITGILKTEKDADEKLALAAGILEGCTGETGLLSFDDISEIHVNNGGDALVYSMSLPVAVRIGEGDLEEGRNKLKKLVKYLQGTSMIKTVKVIDMNNLDGVVVSFKKQDKLSPLSGEENLTVGL